MKLEKLNEIVGSAAALRFRTRLQPAGGQGDKVFPPTYEGGKYAEEKRKIDGVSLPCVHLDSVQSQANRMELALLEAIREGRISIPIVEVDFPAKDPALKDVGIISSFEAPHRMADAILRDSGLGGKRFRDMPEGKLLDESSIHDATGLFGINPASLLFGIWDSTGPKGGLGVKFQRSIVSELVAVDVEKGVKSSSRIDPLGLMVNAGILYTDPVAGGWTLDAKGSDGKALQKVGKDGKPSEANHGNIPPTVTDTNGGVTFSHALQTVVISLPSIRRLGFPVQGKETSAVNLAARSVLAALGLCAAALSISKGYDLRSRCLLVPENAGGWEIVAGDGAMESFSISAEDSCTLLKAAVKAAQEIGLPWREKPLTLVPSDGLVALVRRNRELAMQSKNED